MDDDDDDDILILPPFPRICNVYEAMAARASESPETTAQLVELINYIMECRDSAMFDLREKARTTAEHVLFLMDHAHLHCETKYSLIPTHYAVSRNAASRAADRNQKICTST